VLRVRDDVIVMQTMMWPDEIRKPDFVGLDSADLDVKPQELQMARMLVETLAGDYDADDFEDDYQEALEALVRAKLEGGEVKQLEKQEATGGEVVDLLAALQKSVDAAKSSRGESTSKSDSGSKSTTKKAASKKSTTKKTPAKKTEKKSTAKKSTTKKAAKKAS
jgi:DNA end-binding protein Ku